MKLSRRDVLFLLFSAGLLLAMRGPIHLVIGYALNFENSAASQIVAVPFISAGLIYLNRKQIFASVAYGVLSGSLVLISGVALVTGATVATRLNYSDLLAFQISALVVLWLGGFLLFYGTTTFRAALFPLLFLIFCIPIPSFVLDRTIGFLQLRSADTAYVLLKLTGMPIHREGVIFMMPDLVISVEPQCSGIRSGISLCISSLVAGYVLLKSFWRRGALLLIAVPILIFKNALRIAMLTLLAIHVDKRIMTSELHREGGIPFFVIGLVLLSPMLAWLVRSERTVRITRTQDSESVESISMQPREAAIRTVVPHRGDL
jgi:exosortase